ncbi:O-antigen ligase family protein [Devosia riboflavina]|nr:O-antigen ligase family protein [Devosia riboflavina]
MNFISKKAGIENPYLISMFFSGSVVVSAVTFWSFSGNYAAYISMLLAIPAFALGWQQSFWVVLRSSPVLWASWSGFLLLATAFLFQPALPSVASIGDFLPFALMPIFALAVAPLSSANFTLKHFALLCLAASALAALVGLAGLMLGQDRVTAPEFSPIHFATWAVTFGFMSLALTLSGKSPWRWIAWAGPVLGLLAALASGTRAALVIGCALALLYGCAWVQRRAIPLWFKIAIPLGLMGAVLLAVYLANLAGFSRPWNALRAIAGVVTGDLGQDTSTAYRVEMLRAGWQAFLNAPLVGHGWHNQLQAAMPYLSQMARDGYAVEQWGYIHNDPLSLSVAAGIPGLVAYFLFMAMPLLAAFSRRNAGNWDVRLYLALSFTVGLFVSGMMDVLLMVEMSKILLILVAASLLFIDVRDER